MSMQASLSAVYGNWTLRCRATDDQTSIVGPILSEGSRCFLVAFVVTVTDGK